MKKKNLIVALAMTFVIGLGATAYAASNNGNSASGSANGYGNGSCMSGGGYRMGRLEGFSGQDILSGLLKSKGATDEEITASRDSGKSLVDLLKEKGVTDNEISSYMLSQRTKIIDEAVAAGKITDAQGKTIKERMAENSGNCTPGQGVCGMNRN
ncbi:MAG TPA: hypothetical protein VIK34_07090 [Clostridiaceae bacterium]